MHGRGQHPNTIAALRKVAEERKKKAKARLAEPASGKELAYGMATVKNSG